MFFRLMWTLVILLSVGGAQAAGPEMLPDELVTTIKKSVDRGLKFLRSKQESDGSYSHHVGVTGTVLVAFGESHRAYAYDEGPFIGLAADWLLTQVQKNGSISGANTPTYNTALAIMGLNAVGGKKFGAAIKGGQSFLVGFQTDEDLQYKASDKFYGGIGYGGDERPDLSNLQYALEALRKTSYDPSSDVWAKAQKFVTRCQNRSESNDQTWATDDGGFVYAPGQSFAGGTRSYGAMTFAGLKSLILTRAEKSDPRVKSALGWIQKNYSFTHHPGMDTTSYFYYLQTASEALAAYGETNLPDANGKPRNWTVDLASQLMTLQNKDGSWMNPNKKYWEGNATFMTGRAIIALNNILKTASVTK
jgi:hypothetical protein